MKRLAGFFIISLILTLCGCKTASVENNGTFGVSLTSTYIIGPDTLCVAQIDSVVKSDRLPVLEKWAKSVFKDYETNTSYVYRTLYDKTTNTIYTVKNLDTKTFVLSKRKITVR